MIYNLSLADDALSFVCLLKLSVVSATGSVARLSYSSPLMEKLIASQDRDCHLSKYRSQL